MIKTNTETVRKILEEFVNLQKEKKTLEGNHSMTLREAVRALYPTLQRMKKRGFSTKEIAQKLNENGIAIKPATITKYLSDTETELFVRSLAVRSHGETRQSKKADVKPDTHVTDHTPSTTSKAE